MYDKRTENRICQGDILENFQHRFIYYQNEEKAIITITLPYAIVLTQDCDLEQDYNQRNQILNSAELQNNDKFLQSILICPVFIAESFKIGKHLENIGLIMVAWSSDRWKYITSNQNQRFHYLEAHPEKGMPDIVVDFKHYYTIPREDIYLVKKQNYKISLASLFREDISQRFANYLSRIGLPTNNNNPQ